MPHGAVAQLVAHFHGMEGVRGSNPLSSTGRLFLSWRAPARRHHLPRRRSRSGGLTGTPISAARAAHRVVAFHHGTLLLRARVGDRRRADGAELDLVAV